METFQENLIKKIGKENLKKIQNTRVGIAGAGGLGSNCALNLVRVGFTKFTIVDFDFVSAANLDRQFYFLNQIGKPKTEALKYNLEMIVPELEIKAIKEKVGLSNIRQFFEDCDIIAECFDRAEYKSQLVADLLSLDKFVVAVSGLGGIGKSDEIVVHRIKNNLVIIGDLKSDISEKPALSPRVNVAAAKQADVILEHVLRDS